MRKRPLLIALAVLAGLVLIVLTTSAVVFRLNYCVPILMYHSVSPDAGENRRLNVTPEVFERQMRFLKERGYRCLPLETVAELIRRKERIPARTVAITFDDGYRNVYTHAFPVLQKYGIPATVFVITNEVGRPAQDRLYWEEILRMQDSGLVTIGSHCIGPEPLVNLSSFDAVEREISGSKRILEERLGRRVTLFSYPEGKFDAKIRQAVIRAGYAAAVATNPGKGFPNDDVFALKRLRISSSAKNLFVFWFESSGYYNFIRENRHK